ncbi:MAG: hypothetical protein WAS49_07380 [Candidatus Dechloromonas phosphoritropha]
MKKKYWVILVLIFLVWLDWYIRAPDATARQLTSAIETQASEKLKNYPYKFHVLKFSQGTAYVSTPRSFAVPAFKALAVLYPDINTRNPNDPAFIAVEQLLGEVQSEAGAIVKAQPGVMEVRWELDRDWLSAHHIDIP